VFYSTFCFICLELDDCELCGHEAIYILMPSWNFIYEIPVHKQEIKRNLVPLSATAMVCLKI